MNKIRPPRCAFCQFFRNDRQKKGSVICLAGRDGIDAQSSWPFLQGNGAIKPRIAGRTTSGGLSAMPGRNRRAARNPRRRAAGYFKMDNAPVSFFAGQENRWASTAGCLPALEAFLACGTGSRSLWRSCTWTPTPQGGGPGVRLRFAPEGKWLWRAAIIAKRKKTTSKIGLLGHSPPRITRESFKS